ncbi:MAG: hypothetical protein HDS01_02940 [Bacteroides sp.]|nr:hypothetical protein [Bacteroides sp.]
MNFYKFSAALIVAASSLSASAVDYVPSYALIDNVNYECDDLGVASFNVLDYGVDNTGEKDCTQVIQHLLNVAGGNNYNTTGNHDNVNSSGGVIYFPAGTYMFSGQIIIPRGVTIRGDWKTPEAGRPIQGTIFKITNTTKDFIVMQPSSLVTNLAFWYPDQYPDNITPMPATVLYGQDGYWGNDYCNVRHCTFVNSYVAIRFNPRNGGGCPNIYDIYGTPLSEGFEMDCIADVGRFDRISFSAAYWEGSGLPGSPSPGQIDNWLYDNATGIVMRRNDWSYTCNVDIDGYAVGFHADASEFGSPNGHNYGFNLSNCRTGVKISGSSSAGIMFTDVNMNGCLNGIVMEGGDGPAQFYGCDINAKSAAINMLQGSSNGLMLQDCKINGVTHANGGHFQAVNSTFSKNVNVGPTARTIFTDNTFTSGASLDNKSIFKCAVGNNTGITYPKLPAYERSWMEAHVTTPARKALYVVTDAPSYDDPDRNNRIDPLTRQDCSSQIQAMLDKAGAEGGGIVYLPAGHYLCNRELSIPKGVELKGAGDIPTVPKGNGAILEVNVGEGNENGTPFITMAEESGLRGITINYPRQNNPANVKKYPYSVRGNRDCYIVNLAIRAAYRGVDLFTNKCDRHYVDYLAGHAFMNVARIGGDCEDGVFSNTQCNTIVYACGNESKFGTWHNSTGITGNVGQLCYCQNERDLDFLIIGDCKREFLYNNFLFGCNKGMHFISDKNGGASACRSLGNAVDGAVETFVIDGIASDLDLVNSQIVALNHNSSDHTCLPSMDYLPACFISTGAGVKGKTVTFFSSNNWGGGDYMTWVKGGTVNIALTNMDASGDLFTFYPEEEGTVINVFNGRFNNMKQTLANPSASASRTKVVSSEIEYKGDAVSMKWDNNLPPVREFVKTSALASRTSWIATASKNNSNASKALDGINDTRWDSDSRQTNGDWFNVNFNSTISINTVILDATLSSGDGPAAYIVRAYVDGAWRDVASGENPGGFCIVTFDPVSASQIRVVQTGSKGNYWSIHEFYAGKLALSDIEEIMADRGNDFGIRFDGSSLIAEADNVHIDVYGINGSLVYSSAAADGVADMTGLAKGVYVAIARTATGTAVLKFIR